METLAAHTSGHAGSHTGPCAGNDQPHWYGNASRRLNVPCPMTNESSLSWRSSPGPNDGA
jgi:hypothetical protein